MAPSPPHSRNDFRIAIVCALPIEADAVQAVFDTYWEEEGKHYGKADGDPNEYSTGAIGEHNVVLAYMSGMGKVNAATLAANMKFSFKKITIAFIVGVCGGIPFNDEQMVEIVQGDVVISKSLIQYDVGREYPAAFKLKDTLEESLGRAASDTRSLLAKLGTARCRQKLEDDMTRYLDLLQQNSVAYRYPGANTDMLYAPTYVHKHRPDSSRLCCKICVTDKRSICDEASISPCQELCCDSAQLIERKRLADLGESGVMRQIIHLGRIASGDKVMKSGLHRDKIAKDHKVLAFEMEGAGVWDHFPSILIKGVCDYADSHKNKHWQKYAAASAACCTKAILQIMTPLNMYPMAIWHVPCEQTTQFIGRRAKMAEVHTRLSEVDNPRIVAIYGLEGIGKSRFAWEIANRLRLTRPSLSVFWVQANTTLNFEKDYFELGKTLQVPGVDSKAAKVKDLVQRYLSNDFTEQWLMILDSADDEAIWSPQSGTDLSTNSMSFVQYLPKSPAGHILVTTRTRRVALNMAGKAIVDLGEMELSEAVETLKSIIVNPHTAHDEKTAGELATQLSCLPLALIQAATYINLNDLSFQEYLNLLSKAQDDEIIELLSVDSHDSDREISDSRSPRAVTTTWLLSFGQLRCQYKQATDLLSYMSCLSESSIPEAILPNLSSARALTDALGILRSYSLVKRRGEGHTATQSYDMHRHVRLATRKWLKLDETLSIWTTKAIQRTLEAFSNCDNTTKEGLRTIAAYMPHAQVLCASQSTEDLMDRYHLFKLMASYLTNIGRDNEAVDYAYSHAFGLEQRLGHSHENSLAAYWQLGRILSNSGDWQGSVQHFHRAYYGLKEVCGPQNTNTLKAMQDLGWIYGVLGRLTEAEELLLQAKELAANLLDPLSKTALDGLNDLAYVYMQRGKLVHAEEIQSSVVDARRRALGIEHWSTLQAARDLAAVYRCRGKLFEAEQVLASLCIKMMNVMGPEHFETIDCQSDLGITYSMLGKHAEAEVVLVRLVKDSEMTAGPSSHATLMYKHQLAQVYRAQGRSIQAEAIETENIDLMAKSLGPDHKFLLRWRADLAWSKWCAGQKTEAIRLFWQVVNIEKDTLLQNDLGKWKSVADLAGMLLRSGQLEESVSLSTQAIEQLRAMPTSDRRKDLLSECETARADAIRLLAKRGGPRSVFEGFNYGLAVHSRSTLPSTASSPRTTTSSTTNRLWQFFGY